MAAACQHATTVAGYEDYQAVVQLLSRGIASGILDALEELDAAPDTATDFLNGFWSLSTGLSVDLGWKSSAGIPVRSAVLTASLGPAHTFGLYLRFAW